MATLDNGIANDTLASAERSETLNDTLASAERSKTLLEWNVPSFRRLSLADAEFNPISGSDKFTKAS